MHFIKRITMGFAHFAGNVVPPPSRPDEPSPPYLFFAWALWAGDVGKEGFGRGLGLLDLGTLVFGPVVLDKVRLLPLDGASCF